MWSRSLLAMVLSGGCARATLPGPEDTLQAYARAAATGDEAALYALLTERSQRRLGRPGVAQAVRDGRQDLAAQSRALQSPLRSPPVVHAQLRFADGETVSLAREDGVFRVTSADALPARAGSPVQALDQLRHVLARRSYAGLLRVLSLETRQAIERDLRAIVEGLETPAALDVNVEGDHATVRLRGGHLVVLRREQGYWLVDDFD